MAEVKQIPTRTELRVDGNDIDIFTEYFVGDDVQDILSVDVKESTGTTGGVSYVEGDLLATLQDDNNTIIQINGNGELIIIADDANKYSIVDDSLIYTD